MKKILLIGLIIASMANAQTGGDYDIKKSVVASGGGNSTGDDFALSGGFWVAKTPIILTENIFANGFEN